MPTNPDTIESQTLIIGGSWVRTFHLTKKVDGVETDLDLSLATVDVFLRLEPDDNSDPVTILSKGAGNSFFPTDGTDGRIAFYMDQTQTQTLATPWGADVLSKGYDLDVVYTRSDETPANKTLWGMGTLAASRPRTGAI